MMISPDSLEGWWKLSAAWHEFDAHERRYPFNRGTGSLVFARDGRMMSAIIAEPGIAHPSGYEMEVYSGHFVLAGSEIVIAVEMSSRQSLIGRDLKLSLSLTHDGHQLYATTPKQIDYSLYSGRPFATAYNWYRAPEDRLA